MPSLEVVVGLLNQYGYFLLLPAAVIEGPIIIVIAAFLASTGIFNIYIVYVIAILGDIIGDIMYYWIGRAGRRTIIPKYGKYLGVTEAKIAAAEAHYDKHLWKTLTFGKVTQAPILVIMVLAGATRADFWKYLFIVSVISVPKALVFTALGYYVGQSYTLFDHYFQVYLRWAGILLLIGSIAYLGIRYIQKTRTS